MRKIESFIDFCAGIGAGRLGLEENGLNCVAFSEINSLSEKTYRLLHNCTSEKNLGDLTKLNFQSLPNFDLLIAGFPCQTFSVIGQRKGFEDERGLIIYSLIEILKAKKIPFFILENVKGLVNHDKGRTIATIMTALKEAGYYVDYKVLNSLQYGVPQMRERVYFVGISRDCKIQDKEFLWPDSIDLKNISDYLVDNIPISKAALITFNKYLNNKYNKGKFNIEEILTKEYLVLDTRQSDLRLYENKVPTLRTGRQGIFYVKCRRLCALTGYESLLLQGFDHEKASRILGKISNSILLAQAGNAMTVNVIKSIGKSLLDYVGE